MELTEKKKTAIQRTIKRICQTMIEKYSDESSIVEDGAVNREFLIRVLKKSDLKRYGKAVLDYALSLV